MKFFFWILWLTMAGIEYFGVRALLIMVFHPYNPVNRSSVKTTVFFITTGIILLLASGWLYQKHEIKWACTVAGLPLLAIASYFFIFLILPYLMGKRMS